MQPARACILLSLFVAAGACHKTATSPTATATDSSSTNLFQGALDPGGIAVQTFTVAAGGPLKMTLANVSVDPDQPLAQALTLAVGTPNSDGTCAASTTARAVPALTAQLTGSVQAGTFCVSVADADSRLPQSVNFSVMVVTGSPATQASAPGSSTWTSNIGLGPNGSAARLIPTFAGGTLTVSLDSVSYPDGQLGLALGIPGPGGSGCVFGQVSAGGVSTTVSAPVDAGNFCVEVYDVGRTQGPVTFSTTIVHP